MANQAVPPIISSNDTPQTAISRFSMARGWLSRSYLAESDVNAGHEDGIEPSLRQ